LSECSCLLSVFLNQNLILETIVPRWLVLAGVIPKDELDYLLEKLNGFERFLDYREDNFVRFGYDVGVVLATLWKNGMFYEYQELKKVLDSIDNLVIPEVINARKKIKSLIDDLKARSE